MDIILKNKKLTTKICKTSEERERGMKHQDFTEFESMLFLLGKDYECFWMKDCIIPLDILFLDHKFSIVKIFDSCPECKTGNCEKYCSEGNYVLELPSKYCKNNGVKIGDVITLSF
jgi:uncharacterized membrane protein (UPF0127 family)